MPESAKDGAWQHCVSQRMRNEENQRHGQPTRASDDTGGRMMKSKAGTKNRNYMYHNYHNRQQHATPRTFTEEHTQYSTKTCGSGPAHTWQSPRADSYAHAIISSPPPSTWNAFSSGMPKPTAKLAWRGGGPEPNPTLKLAARGSSLPESTCQEKKEVRQSKIASACW